MTDAAPQPDDARPPGDAAGAGDWSSALLEMAGSDLYRNNAFRVLGLGVGVQAQDWVRAQAREKLRARYGADADKNTSPAALFPLDPPPDEQARRQAQQRLNDPECQLLDELFWFWPRQGQEDDPLIDLARTGDITSALASWEQREAEQTMGRTSAHNLAVFYHCTALDLDHKASRGPLSDAEVKLHLLAWGRCNARWKRLIGDEAFWSRMRTRAAELRDPRLTDATVQSIRRTLPRALAQISARLAVRHALAGNEATARLHARQVAGAEVDEPVRRQVILDSLATTRERLRLMCESARAATEADPEKGKDQAQTLVDGGGRLLTAVDVLLAPGSAAGDGEHDRLAETARTCIVKYCNKRRDWKFGLELHSRLLEMARGEELLAMLGSESAALLENRKDDLCRFCEKNEKDRASRVEVPVHQSYLENGRKRSRSVIVKLRRCTECRDRHARLRRRAVRAAWVGASLAMCGFAGTGAGAIWLAPLLLLVLPVLGWCLGERWGAAAILAGTKPARAALEFDRVREHRQNGWMLGELPPGYKLLPAKPETDPVKRILAEVLEKD